MTMREPYHRSPSYGVSPVTRVAVDEGLRAYMLRVYNYMASGVALTGLTAWLTFKLAVASTAGGGLALTGLGQALYASPLAFVIMLAPLGLVFLFGYRIGRMSVRGAQMLFWVFAGLLGLSLSSIFLVYAHGSIARVFFISAAAFAALSLYGYTTRRDLSAWGRFFFMGLIGLIIASLVNLFFASSALEFAISAVGVLVFAGLTAYDTQRIKELYYAGGGADVVAKRAVMGALTLYLDFINLFLMLLRFMGDRR